jgi:hypothetical protein
MADALSRAAKWLKDHPEAVAGVAGTIVVIATISLVVETVGGTMVLTPVAAAV